jgi:crotonobetainyl-CoA:carnitine CoA-transferase CaiB-like acyl-CoA transferase
LFQRERNGEGAWLDLALLDVAVAMNANQGANYLATGRNPERSGNAHPNLAPYEVFEAADGYFILAVGNDVQFKKLCEMCSCPELADDERFATNSGRIRNLKALRPILAAILIQKPRQYWSDLLDARGISWGAVNTLAEVFADEQVRHRRMLRYVNHPVLGDIPLVGNPMLAGHQHSAHFEPPPLLGEHTSRLLKPAKEN